MQRLSEADCWLMDGTFNVVPRIFRQLFVIHGRIGTEIIPLVFGLMSAKSKIGYESFFSELTRISNELNLKLKPRRIISDFEKASVAAARVHFPKSEFKGCLFHFGQIIWRQIQKKGFSVKYGENEVFSLRIRMIKSLAFVPPDEILDYYSELNNDLKMDKDAKIMSDWFEKNYVGVFPKTAIRKVVQPQYHCSFWSVTGSEKFHFPRTQNNAESWHRRLQVVKNNIIYY